MFLKRADRCAQPRSQAAVRSLLTLGGVSSLEGGGCKKQSQGLQVPLHGWWVVAFQSPERPKTARGGLRSSALVRPLFPNRNYVHVTSAAWHFATQNTRMCWCNTNVRGTGIEYLGFCRSAVPWSIYSMLEQTVLKSVWFFGFVQYLHNNCGEGGGLSVVKSCCASGFYYCLWG